MICHSSHSNSQQTMSTLEFKQVFSRGCKILPTDIPTVMNCKNIDFGYVNWPIGFFTYMLRSDNNLVIHMVDNLVDVNVHNNNDISSFTFLRGVMSCGGDFAARYLCNNMCVNGKSFESITLSPVFSKIGSMCKQSINLAKHLNKTSLYKFAGYYNTEKYYYMINVMLLVMKARKVFVSGLSQGVALRILPNQLIKCLIIPFIYR